VRETLPPSVFRAILHLQNRRVQPGIAFGREPAFLRGDDMTSPQPQPRLDDLRIERSSTPAPRSRTPAIVFALVVIALVGGVIWWLMRPAAIPVRTAIARELASAAPGERTVLNASGYVTARREATVSSKITGKVTEVLIEEGVQVKEGQVLARLDDTNVRASFQLAQAQLASARSSQEETRVRLKEAEQELQRQEALSKGNAGTRAEFERAEAAVLAFRARLAQQQAEASVAESTVAVWARQVEDTIIRAPFGGIVTSKNAQPGEMISPMSSGGFTRTGICTIVDMDSLEIEIDVNESYINRVQPGQPVEATLDAYADWKIPCKVIAIIPTADRQKSTVRVRVGFDRLDPRILPEMAVKVAFREMAGAAASAGNDRRTIVVPKTAVRQRDGRDVAFVFADGRAERRAISVSATQGDETVLSAGLSAGEKVIVDAPADLADGAKVSESR
jgi:HlyD family secretion protein